jgi:hypothetical protein
MRICISNLDIFFRRSRIVYPVKCEAYLTGEFSQFLQEIEKEKKNPENPVDPVQKAVLK